MNVWVMNLRNFQQGSTLEEDKQKFSFCKKKKILGSGSLPDSENKFFLKDLKIGDLVWVKNISANANAPKWYICKIKSEVSYTTEDKFNSMDIGCFCNADYYPVKDMPEQIDEASLTTDSLIAPIDGITCTVTEDYLDSLLNKNKKRIKQIIIGSAGLAAAFLLVFGGLKIYKLINIKTHPALPDIISMGEDMYKIEIDELLSTNLAPGVSSAIEKDIAQKRYMAYLDDKKFNTALSDLYGCNITVDPLAYFNDNEKLYWFGYVLSVDDYSSEQLSERMNMFQKYYQKAMGKKIKAEINKDLGCPDLLSFEIDGVNFCITFNESGLSFVAYSEELEPQFINLSEDEILDAFNNVTYEVDGSKMNLSKLILKCVTNRKIDYQPYRDCKYELDDYKSLESVYSDGDYLSSAYVVTVHGNVQEYSDSKYWIDKDVDAVKVLLLFDDNEEFIDSQILEHSSSFESYAISYERNSTSSYYSYYY